MKGNNNGEDIEDGNKMGYIAHKDGERVQTVKEQFGRNGRESWELCRKVWKKRMGLLLWNAA